MKISDFEFIYSLLETGKVNIAKRVEEFSDNFDLCKWTLDKQAARNQKNTRGNHMDIWGNNDANSTSEQVFNYK